MTTRRRRTISNGNSDNNNENEYDYRNPPPQGRTTIISTSTPLRIPVCDPDMSGRDRTTEFHSAVTSIQSRQSNGVLSTKHRNKEIHQRSIFTEKTKLIGRDLANSFSKLEKLTLLAKRKSLFDDKPVEIQELTYIIKQDINSLNKQISQLQDIARSHSRKNGKNIETHSKTVVVALQSKLATMSSDFKQVLEVRTENMKQQNSRRDQFSQSHIASTMPPSALSGHTGSVLLQDEAQASSGSVAINMDGAENQRYHQQMQLINEQDSYIQSRADTMQNIESTIVELGGIFQQLAHMVKEHEEIITRIDGNVEDTSLNVEAAHSEILKYFQSVTNNRWLMIKVFAVLIVFFIVFIVFLA